LGHGQPLDEIILELPSIRLCEILEVVGQFAILLLELAEFLEFFEPLTTTFERAPDRRQAGCETALEHGESQSDIAVFSGFRTLEVVLHVLGHGIVETEFLWRELIR